MQIDPYILAFSAITVIVTVWMGFRAAKSSKTTSDFFVAGRSVGVGMNASAISGEYLSAASFMGIAGMVMSSGYDALWYPVCYACGYLFLLLFIAGPLRRFGAYTIPDFAEGRFDSPVFRKIAVVFVLFIGFFYTMPQMKGAGTTLAYIFPGLPYWVGVVLVGAVITLNVALGGMKGITLVQAFQYWAKMFAISVPIFVLMAVYGGYGKQLKANDGNGSKNTLVTAGIIQYESYSRTSDISPPPPAWQRAPRQLLKKIGVKIRGGDIFAYGPGTNSQSVDSLLLEYATIKDGPIWAATNILNNKIQIVLTNYVAAHEKTYLPKVERALAESGIAKVTDTSGNLIFVFEREKDAFRGINIDQTRLPLPAKAPADATWLNPFGPLTTKAAKAAKPSITFNGELNWIDLKTQTTNENTLELAVRKLEKTPKTIAYPAFRQKATDLIRVYAMVEVFSEPLSLSDKVSVGSSASLNELEIQLEAGNFNQRERAASYLHALTTNGVTVVRENGNTFKAFLTKEAVIVPVDTKPYALLYTYSLIIALVCGTAGLPHILVRFYTNPDGVAAKRTTMWVMILIGVFYVFPPVFGVMGRNLLPELYTGTGAKGTDKVVLELPRILNSKAEGNVPRRGEGSEGQTTVSPSPAPSQPSPPSRDTSSSGIPWGSILSGITCAGAFAAFMSTFSGLLVSMTGALAHDVYGRMLNPKATPEQRMKMFKWCAVLVGGVAVLLGSFVEPLQINFMVGQAFAIAAASYFPLLFMAVWWRKLTMQGAATGMLSGGLLAVFAISLTSMTDLGLLPLAGFWASHPLLRILCEQPALWAVPLAIGLMVIVSKLTSKDVPEDIRMKMLVLHAPEKLGLKQEYIQEQQQGH